MTENNDPLIQALKAQKEWADKRLWSVENLTDAPGYEMDVYTIAPGAVLLGGSYNYEYYSILLTGLVEIMQENGNVTQRVSPFIYKVPANTRHLIKAWTQTLIICVHPKD